MHWYAIFFYLIYIYSLFYNQFTYFLYVCLLANKPVHLLEDTQCICEFFDTGGLYSKVNYRSESFA